ncbi:MAG: response regulator, partial [Maribacter sp.]
MTSINCIVVDDEELARSLLVSYISKLDFLHLVGEAENPLVALQLMKEHSVDLLFLDIQ